ncbi:MAG: glutamate racemase [Spirochaetes bacterium]|nr:glutamate racemase [Spirochaetota bacterium]
MHTDKRAAIGVFDSGIGGLTVARAVHKLLPREHIVYFGDLLHLPYGSKSETAVVQFSLAACRFLCSQNIKLLVVACNTAASLAMKRIVSEVDVPVIGVVGPGAKTACAATRNNRVGVIGTSRTIESGSYRSAIAGINPLIMVFEKPTPLLVPMIEEGWIGHPVLRLVLQEYLGGFITSDIDTIVLGCTHYPLIRREIEEVLDGTKTVQVVDSADSTALKTKRLLEENDLQRPPGKVDTLKVWLTDSTPGFRVVAERIMGKESIDVSLVDSGYCSEGLRYSASDRSPRHE